MNFRVCEEELGVVFQKLSNWLSFVSSLYFAFKKNEP